MRLALALYGGLLLASGGISAEEDYDLVIRNGLIADPATHTLTIADIGIREDTIINIGHIDSTGRFSIDAAGLVVAPGFIDLHQHGQHAQAYALSALDGVTSSFEIETGAVDVNGWYEQRKGGQHINYGIGVGHIQARIEEFEDPAVGSLPTGPGAFEKAGEVQRAAIVERIRAGLEQGAVAVGMGPEYTPAADDAELRAVLQTAVAHDASVHVHLPAGISGLKRMLRLAGATGARLHIVHVNSAAGEALELYLSEVHLARLRGLPVTMEAYPYGASMTRIEAAKFADWPEWPDEKFARFQWASTGEWLNRDSFERYRDEQGIIIYHARDESLTRRAISDPAVMIASDGFIRDDIGHPRASGTFSRVLGRYVRERESLTLLQALSKMTIEPARVLQSRVRDMARRGRLCRGCAADVVVFDPDTVMDRSTFEHPGLASEGIRHVIVNGESVVSEGKLSNALPGRPIRR